MPTPDGRTDLRSDTVTRPTNAMRHAMARADVGDDVYAEDPTVRRLEETVAAMFGREAALFVPSGVMGNQICLRLVVPPAEELLCDTDAHVVTYENGGAAQHGGIQTRTVPAPYGVLDPATVAEQLRPPGYGAVVTRALSVEQTHNRAGGTVVPLSILERLRALTRGAGVAMHCDGARIWNAHVASGVALSDYGALFDTLSVCLSKGLGAPVGSLVIADADRIAAARTLRQRLGGGMRQAGVLAAAGLVAVRTHVERLAEDHARARCLAELLADVVPESVDVDRVETNILPLDLSGCALTARELAARAAEEGVLVSVLGPTRVRLVLHLDADDSDVDRAAKVVGGLLRA